MAQFVFILAIASLATRQVTPCSAPPTGQHPIEAGLAGDIVLALPVQPGAEVKETWEIKSAKGDKSDFRNYFQIKEDGPIRWLIAEQGLPLSQRQMKISIQLVCRQNVTEQVYNIRAPVVSPTFLGKAQLKVPEDTAVGSVVSKGGKVVDRGISGVFQTRKVKDESIDAGRFFSLDEKTGSIIVKSELDYESDTKALKMITVQKHRGRTRKVRVFWIKVTNVNDNPPVIFLDPCHQREECNAKSYKVEARQNGVLDFHNGSRLETSDDDGDEVIFSITRVKPEEFASTCSINKSTGVISMDDIENIPDKETLYLTVQASDGKYNDTVTIEVKVNKVRMRSLVKEAQDSSAPEDIPEEDLLWFLNDPEVVDELTSPVPNEMTSPVPHEMTSPVPHEMTSPVPHEMTSPVPHEMTSAVPNELTSPVPNELTSPVPNEMTSPVPHEMTSPVPHEMTSPVPHEMTSPVPHEMTSAVPNELTSPVPNELTSPVPNEMTSPVPHEMTSPVLNELTSPVPNKLTSPVSNELTSPVPHDMTSPVPNQMTSPVPNEMMSPVPNELASPVPNEMTSEVPEDESGMTSTEGVANVMTTTNLVIANLSDLGSANDTQLASANGSEFVNGLDAQRLYAANGSEFDNAVEEYLEQFVEACNASRLVVGMDVEELESMLDHVGKDVLLNICRQVREANGYRASRDRGSLSDAEELSLFCNEIPSSVWPLVTFNVTISMAEQCQEKSTNAHTNTSIKVEGHRFVAEKSSDGSLTMPCCLLALVMISSVVSALVFA